MSFVAQNNKNTSWSDLLLSSYIYQGMTNIVDPIGQKGGSNERQEPENILNDGEHIHTKARKEKEENEERQEKFKSGRLVWTGVSSFSFVTQAQVSSSR